MKYPSYLDFELKIEKQGDNYTASVIRSPAGEASRSFKLPFEGYELKFLILQMGQSRKGIRKIHSEEGKAAREIGERLFDAVFSDNLLECYRESLKHAQPDKGLRLKLVFHNAAELADIPWEFLFDAGENRFVAQSHLTPVVRYTGLPDIPPISLKLPLRILIAISSPSDCEKYEKLDVEGEISRLRQALMPLIKTGRVKVKGLKHVTFKAVQRILRNETFHIFHFIGHGGFDTKNDEGVLVMEDAHGKGLMTDPHRIGALLHGHHSLRLAVLNCCESARVSQKDPFAGVADALIQQGIPAVAAMQFPISDEAAKEFADEFYTALTDGFPADAAMAEARKAVFGMPNDAEWGTPVLYMRSADGLLFRFEDGTEIPEDKRPIIEVVSPKIEQPKQFTNSIGMEFVWIPPGEFMMGSPEDEPGRNDDETLHRVKLTRGFYMQTTTVTQGQWKALMGNNPSYFKDGGDKCPVERVSWDDAQEFMKNLNQAEKKEYRLPTEAEWEYACRAGSQTVYNWGNSADCSRANYGCGFSGECKGKNPERTMPVASFPPNVWRLYDMHGNVWEWCQDWYGDYPTFSVTDPIGTSSGSDRVARGGCWVNRAQVCRSASRYGNSPDDRNLYLGFRLVLLVGQQG